MSEEMIINNCSPTLAGLKTGSLFTAAFRDETERVTALRSWNFLLRKKGLRAVPLGEKNGRTLVYVYRISRLCTDLRDSAARSILSERGYDCDRPESCIAHLAGRLQREPEFPHEIGLFLGYPPEDVSGFIGGKPCKLTGAWKVYGDEERAARTFARYRKCTSVYAKLYAAGKPMDKLVVAG